MLIPLGWRCVPWIQSTLNGGGRDQHGYIKASKPNGKAERSHRTDKKEFNQLLTNTD
jgi:hypothetical protein